MQRDTPIEFKKAKSEILEPVIDQALPEEWGIAKDEKITGVFYVLDKTILCYQDAKGNYYLKIIEKEKSYSLYFDYRLRCHDILVYSERLLFCYAECSNSCSVGRMLDLDRKEFVASIEYVSSAFIYKMKFVGLVHVSPDEKILVGLLTEQKDEARKVKWGSDSYNYHYLLSYKFEEFHKRFLSRTREYRPKFKQINRIESPSNFLIIDSDKQSLIFPEYDDTYRVDSKGKLISVPTKKYLHTDAKWMKFRDYYGYHLELPDGNHLVIDDYKWPGEEIQLLDKNYKKIASCSVGRIKKIHKLSDNKTFVVETIFNENYQLGVVKLTQQGKLEIEYCKLPYRVSSIVVNEKKVQIICLLSEHSTALENLARKDVMVLSEFPLLLNFAAMDDALKDALPTPLRGMVRGYLGDSSRYNRF